MSSNPDLTLSKFEESLEKKNYTYNLELSYRSLKHYCLRGIVQNI